MRVVTWLWGTVTIVGCFQTTIPGPNGQPLTIKTPCDARIWALTKRYGQPDQVLFQDHDYWRIRYYYASTRMEYRFGWWETRDDPQCEVSQHLHLTDDGIQ